MFVSSRTFYMSERYLQLFSLLPGHLALVCSHTNFSFAISEPVGSDDTGIPDCQTPSHSPIFTATLKEAVGIYGVHSPDWETKCSAKQIYRIQTLKLKLRFSDSKFLLLAQEGRNKKNCSWWLVTNEETNSYYISHKRMVLDPFLWVKHSGTIANVEIWRAQNSKVFEFGGFQICQSGCSTSRVCKHFSIWKLKPSRCRAAEIGILNL